MFALPVFALPSTGPVFTSFGDPGLGGLSAMGPAHTSLTATISGTPGAVVGHGWTVANGAAAQTPSLAGQSGPAVASASQPSLVGTQPGDVIQAAEAATVAALGAAAAMGAVSTLTDGGRRRGDYDQVS